MKEIIKQFFQDKNGNFSLREAVTLFFVLIIAVSWISEQFFHYPVPEHVFYSLTSLVGAGCFGYSIERKSKPDSTEKPFEA